MKNRWTVFVSVVVVFIAALFYIWDFRPLDSTECYLYPITKNGLVGFIDGRGTKRVSPQYDQWNGTATRNQTLYAVKGSTWTKISITSSGEITTEELPFAFGAKGIFDLGDGLYTLYYEGTDDPSKGHFTTHDTKRLFAGDAVQKNYKFTEILSEGLLRFWDPVKQKCGFADRHGNTVIPAEKYPYIDSFHEGAALMYIMLDGHRTWGFVDRKGEEIIPPQYWAAAPFSSGMANVCDEHGWFYIRKDGTRVFDDSVYYSVAGSFTCGRAFVKPLNCTLFGFINTSGKMVIPAIYHTGGAFRGGFAYVCLTPLMENNPRTRCIDTEGNTIYEGDYYAFDHDYSGPLVWVEGRGFSGYINRGNGRMVWKEKSDEHI